MNVVAIREIFNFYLKGCDILKATVLGGYAFTSKKGTTCYKLTVSDEPESSVGTCCKNLMAVKLPCDLKDMVGKIYLIDTNGDFASDFYQLK